MLNALWAAPDVTGRGGRFAPGLPHDAVLELLARARPARALTTVRPERPRVGQPA